MTVWFSYCGWLRLLFWWLFCLGCAQVHLAGGLSQVLCRIINNQTIFMYPAFAYRSKKLSRCILLLAVLYLPQQVMELNSYCGKRMLMLSCAGTSKFRFGKRLREQNHLLLMANHDAMSTFLIKNQPIRVEIWTAAQVFRLLTFLMASLEFYAFFHALIKM